MTGLGNAGGNGFDRMTRFHTSMRPGVSPSSSSLSSLPSSSSLPFLSWRRSKFLKLLPLLPVPTSSSRGGVEEVSVVPASPSLPFLSWRRSKILKSLHFLPAVLVPTFPSSSSRGGVESVVVPASPSSPFLSWRPSKFLKSLHLLLPAVLVSTFLYSSYRGGVVPDVPLSTMSASPSTAAAYLFSAHVPSSRTARGTLGSRGGLGAGTSAYLAREIGLSTVSWRRSVTAYAAELTAFSTPSAMDPRSRAGPRAAVAGWAPPMTSAAMATSASTGPSGGTII